ncbi:MAG: NADH-quinone oxidoreductase subunit K, partial [Ardenticatenaceae bacterium]|nr:NADH-quinone oxidoreductase subunit K [Ardenticatenaceae bacterium]
MELLTAIGIGVLFGVALYQMLQRNVIRSAMGVILLGSAINLFLLAAGSVNGVVPAYSTVAGLRADALPQALVLTAVVISMGGLAFILSMLYI